jgi:DNA repair exonuclease SbcCD ATPase subunit
MSDFITKNLAQIILELQDRNDEKRSQIEMLENELSDYQQKTTELKEALAHADVEIKRLTSANDAYEDHRIDQEAWNDSKREAFAHADVVIARLTSQLKESIEKYQALGYKNVELEESLRKATQQYTECWDLRDEERERFENTMDNCERENEKLETKLDRRRASDMEEATYYLNGIETYIRTYENVHKVGSYCLPISWYVQKIILKQLSQHYRNYEFKNCKDYVEIDFDPTIAEL